MAHDPTRDEMLAYLHELFDMSESEAEFDCEEAIYWFAADYHGGQGSNLYAALCASPYKPGMAVNGPQSFDADCFYAELAGEFAP